MINRNLLISVQHQVADWPKLDLRLGQVVAVSIGIDGHPVIFHRADRIWTDE